MRPRDFEGSLYGFGQYFKCGDSRHGKLVMCESSVVSESVDAARRNERKNQHESCVDVHVQENEKVIQQLQQGEEEYVKDIKGH